MCVYVCLINIVPSEETMKLQLVQQHITNTLQSEQFFFLSATLKYTYYLLPFEKNFHRLNRLYELFVSTKMRNSLRVRARSLICGIKIFITNISYIDLYIECRKSAINIPQAHKYRLDLFGNNLHKIFSVVNYFKISNKR